MKQARALLDLIAAERERRSTAERETARERARRLLGEARAEARRRLREAAAAERARLADGEVAAQARLDTAQRAHARRRAVALLAQALPRLPEALRELWRQPAARAAWTRHLAEAARRALPPGGWRVEHPPGWSGEERQAFAARCAEEIAFAADAGLEAGLRICRDGNRVDGSLQALLADRREIESRLLLQLEGAGGAVNDMERAQPANERHPLPREGGRGDGRP